MLIKQQFNFYFGESMCPRFSDHFELNRTQAELDFVDIELDRDIPLFVDPYAISIYPGIWHEECSALIVNFFSNLVDHLSKGKREDAYNMLRHLREPNSTRLGFSKAKPRGSGIGTKYAEKLITSIIESRAAQTGQLKDISDCELMIEGVSSDRISDMTINIIRHKLIEYTQAQCELWDIPMQKVQAGVCWNPTDNNWINFLTKLPIYNNTTILLTPRNIVRYRSIIDHQKYYNGFVLNFLQAEHLKANTGLVTVLRNKKGKEKRVVYKKTLKESYPQTKEFIAQFAQERPETMEKYKSQAKAEDSVLSPEGIESKQEYPKPIVYQDITAELANTPAGREHADVFHNIIIGALVSIFSPDIMNPKKEVKIHDGRKRVDIVFDNCCEFGFFKSLSGLHNIHCPYIFVECKNYNGDMRNPEFDQLTGRFSDKKGRFGILVCRDKGDKRACVNRCKDIVNDNRGYVLVLDDNDINQLLEKRAQNNKDLVDGFMRDLLRNTLL